MPKLTDKEIKQILQDYLDNAYEETGINPYLFKPKLIGKKKRYPSMKSGYYVYIQNFSRADNSVKKSTSGLFFRYIFRSIQFKESDTYLLEIAYLTPEMGLVENSKVIWRSDKNSGGDFLSQMIDAMNRVKINI